MSDVQARLAETLHAMGLGCHLEPDGRDYMVPTPDDAARHLRDARIFLAHLPPGLIIATVDELARAVKKHASTHHGNLWTTCPCGVTIAAAIEGLNRAAGYLRHEVAKQVPLKFLPDYRFELDNSFDEGARIDALLNSPEVKRDIMPESGKDPDHGA